MIFGNGYNDSPHEVHHDSDLHSVQDQMNDPGQGGHGSQDIEGTASANPIIRTGELGMSVTEGSRFGSLIQTATEAVRQGVKSIELATIQGGGEPGGVESYGWEARQALRELAKANSVYFSSIHTPANTVGNLSGFNYQERGFNDEFRHRSLEEVKKSIVFAADVGAGAVVVHTGEAQRDMSMANWNREIAPGVKQFLSFDEEPGRQVLYMVDDRSGRLITEVRKSQLIYEPKFKMLKDQNGVDRYVDKDGNILDDKNMEDLFKRVPIWNSERTKFESEARTWDYFVNLSSRWNKEFQRKDPHTGKVVEWTPEEMFFRKQIEAQILSSRGNSLYHGREYDNMIHDRQKLLSAQKYYQKVEDQLKEKAPEEMYKLQQMMAGMRSHWGREAQRFIPEEKKLPTEIIKQALRDIDLQMKYTHEASATADSRADEMEETLRHVQPVARYAKEKTSWSYAEAAILAMEQTKKNPHAKRDVFLAPENIFPEMGFGSHPQELIELVQDARTKMVQLLTAKQIPNPHEIRYVDPNTKEQKLKMIANPYYTGMNQHEAEEYAKRHIKATLDTQHLGMWWKHFQPLPGETVDQRRDRFNKWYGEQVDQLVKADVLGHIHAVDAMGGGHHHLPIGQGNLPVKWALERLKKSGFKGTMVSEGWEEDARFGKGRQISVSWRNLGSPFVGKGYSVSAPSNAWSDVRDSYFRSMQSPYFVFGAYAPSNDWQLWTQVPME